MKELGIIVVKASSSSEDCLQKLAAWMGVQRKIITIEDGTNPVQQLAKQSLDSGLGRFLAISADTLVRILEAASSPALLQKFLETQCKQLLVFACNDSPRHCQTLSALTGGAIQGISFANSEAGTFNFPEKGRQFNRQFTGLSFSLGRQISMPAFQLHVEQHDVEPLMLLVCSPVFICRKQQSCQMFLLTGSQPLDINESLFEDRSIGYYYDRIIPLLVFLRYCFGDGIWHGIHSTARVIIDDPLLKERYGFLEYKNLLNSIKKDRYGASVAFIPWNYRRTSRHMASMLSNHSSALSICVHGCDHTNNEFGILDQTVLSQKARLAVERMKRHQERTGLPFEEVMVFPQGLFSRDALGALRANEYLAVVNTSCFPANGQGELLRISDFLRPAVTRFYGFPIFQRHSSQHLIDFAFALFLGNPALIVTHHLDFMDNGEKIAQLARDLTSIEPNLSWPTLEYQLTRSCVVRLVADDTAEVQFFTRKFYLPNKQNSQVRFLLRKYEPEPSVISTVSVNGTNVPFSFTDGFLMLEVEAASGEMICIDVRDHRWSGEAALRSSAVYSMKVLLRRVLSEFRDNTLMRHPKLYITRR